MKKIIAGVLLAAGLVSPVFASKCFVVVPLVGRAGPTASIQVNLASATLPAATAGLAYPSFDFKPYLSVTGDPNYASSGVSWQLASGSVPAGLSLNADGTLSGTPADNAGIYNFSVAASYKGVSSAGAYSLTVQPAAQATFGPGAGYSAQFPLTAVNDYSSQTMVLKNTGSVTLKITAIGGKLPFSLNMPRSTTLLPGASANFAAVFQPSSAGTFTATYSVSVGDSLGTTFYPATLTRAPSNS